MRICIDPGHGQDNRKAGVYDPGACHIEGNRKYEEADIVLDYARDLADKLTELRHDVMLTRGDRKDPCPVWKRAAKAELWKADALVSLHVNDADSDTANGCEVLFRRGPGIALADAALRAVIRATGFKDRGVKVRNDLSVLEFSGVAILVELGFIAHDQNREALLNREIRARVCGGLATAIHEWKRG